MAKAAAPVLRRDETAWLYDQWRLLGFDPPEAIELAESHLSPSLVREFCREHTVDAKLATRILY